MKIQTIMMYLIPTSLALVVLAPDMPAKEWKLILAHDNEGKVIEGSKERLKNLVLKGNPVRVTWKIQDDFSHIVNGEFISVMNDEVLAQIRPIYPQNPDFTDSHITFRSNLQGHWSAIFSTTGKVEYYLSSQVNSTTGRHALEWYVEL